MRTRERTDDTRWFEETFRFPWILWKLPEMAVRELFRMQVSWHSREVKWRYLGEREWFLYPKRRQ